MSNKYWYITDEQIAIAKEKGACAPAITLAEKERDWRKISANWLHWDCENTKMCPAEALAEFSKDSNLYIRCSVAQHPNTPAEVVEEAINLINDKSISVRSYICDPEYCGHRESVILSHIGYVPICFSIDELREFLLLKPIDVSMVEYIFGNTNV